MGGGVCVGGIEFVCAAHTIERLKASAVQSVRVIVTQGPNHRFYQLRHP